MAHFIAIRNLTTLSTLTPSAKEMSTSSVRSLPMLLTSSFVKMLNSSSEEYRPKLASLTFHTKLGSMLDKSERIEKLVNELIPTLGLEVDQAIFARRAAHLMKADLATQMVTEMTSLQGIIGGEYALRSGEQQDIAIAIGEQYQTVPQTKAGLAMLSLTDLIFGWVVCRRTRSYRCERPVRSTPRRDWRCSTVDRT